jgi:hypothetical protein
MRNRISALTGLGVAAALAAPTPSASLAAQDVPPSYFYAKNNSSAKLTCRTRRQDGAWSGWFTIPPGGEWGEDDARARLYYIYCRGPVDQVIYPLHSHQRYSFLRERGGHRVRLRHIVVGHGS